MGSFIFPTLNVINATRSSVYSVSQFSLPGYKEVGTLPQGYNILLTISIPLRNQELIYSLAKEVSTPGSPMYMHFLTKQQIADLFYPTQKYNEVLSYLKSKGLNVVSTAMDSIIVVSGSVSEIEQDLGLSTVLFSNGTYKYYEAIGTPSITGVYVYSSNITGLVLRHPPYLVTKSAVQSLMSRSQPNMTFPIMGYSAKVLQKVYNASTLISNGYNGSGFTIGVLDFYGDPYAAQVLQYFDNEFGIPNPPSFKIVPIGPYNPNIGIITGWDGEISGDIELSHAMAPGANEVLYVANGALPLDAIIATINQQGIVNTVSQSWSIFEWYISVLGPSFFVSNIYQTDQYYALGTLEGITFTASTGDAGGSGYSSGPLGTTGYPSTSPFVVATGGTTVYVSGNSSIQTAWSNYGFIPFLVNYGGTTGGVSMVEPTPWYQEDIPVPATYPNGRMVPDIVLSASVYPGTYVVFSGNQTGLFGGTSEASPLLAGLLTDAMSYANHSLGFVNPYLYKLAANTDALTPVTFGYNIPWVASSKYNLVSGLGAPNVGNIAMQLAKYVKSKSLSISVFAFNASLMQPANEEFFPGQRMYVLANITYNGQVTNTGTFYAQLQTLSGVIFNLPMSFNDTLGLWEAEATVPSNAQGISFVNTYGEYGNISGTGFTEIYTGYLDRYLSPYPVLPESLQLGVPVVMYIMDLQGNLISSGDFRVVPEFYNISTNAYTPSAPINLTFNSSLGAWLATLQGVYPRGPVDLVTQGSYGYLPFMSGSDLQTFFILPETVVEPGAVSPGQYIFIQGLVLPEENTLYAISSNTGLSVYQNIMFGSNVTAYLVSPGGKIVSSSVIPFNSEKMQYYGSIEVPENATPGLYTVLLHSTYNSITFGLNFSGSFFGQILISKGQSIPVIHILKQAYEGQNLQVYASITYPNGSEVKYGMYVAGIYSRDSESNYGKYVGSGVPLQYNSTLNLWTGSVALPTPYNQFLYNSTSGEVFFGPQGYSGPYEVYVSGISWDGVPTTSLLSAQKDFYVNPQLYIFNKTLTSPEQTSGLALSYVVISLNNGTMTGNVFLGGDKLSFSETGSIVNSQFYGTNYINGGNVTLSSTFVSGALYVYNSSVVLFQTDAEEIIATNSNIKLLDSRVGNLVMINSTVSGYTQASTLTPSPTNIDIISPTVALSYYSTIPFEINVTGTDVSSVQVYVDGQIVKSFTGSGLFTFSLNASSYPDGTHTVQVISIQSDGVSSQATTQFYTNAQQYIVAQKTSSEITSLNSTLTANAQKTSSEITSLNSTLTATHAQLIATSNEYFYTNLLLGIVALVIALLAVYMKRK